MRPLFFLLLLAACQNEPQIKVSHVSKQEVSIATPPSWNQLPAKGMRLETYEVKEGTKTLDVSVIFLEGRGGSDLANINRWRREIDLPPIEEYPLNMVKTPLGEGRFVELEGERQSSLILFVRQQKGVWFFKMKGDPTLVKQEKGAFLNFVESYNR